MQEILPYVSYGAVLGLTSGILPGPLLTLAVSETLKHSKSEGIKIAFSPLITDPPIAIFTIYILSNLKDSDYILGGISIVGAFALVFIAFESLSTKAMVNYVEQAPSKSLIKGMAVNILSPRLYIFWLTIGAPIIIKAYDVSLYSSIAFIISLYFCYLSSKILVIVLVDKSKRYLKNKGYLYMMRILGFLLIIFAMLFFRDGLELLKLS